MIVNRMDTEILNYNGVGGFKVMRDAMKLILTRPLFCPKTNTLRKLLFVVMFYHFISSFQFSNVGHMPLYIPCYASQINYLPWYLSKHMSLIIFIGEV